MNNINDITSEQLKLARIKSGLSVAEAAEIFGYKYKTWLNKENGSSSGKIKKIEYEFFLMLTNEHDKFIVKKLK
ncbi:hypothetical protein GKR75_08170 [Providencia sp. wls1919]|nr:hypothetical protein [Providencia sp. wls1919]